MAKGNRGPLSCLEGRHEVKWCLCVCGWYLALESWAPLCSQLCEHASFPFYVLEFEGISFTIQNAPGGGRAVGGVWGHL